MVGICVLFVFNALFWSFRLGPFNKPAIGMETYNIGVREIANEQSPFHKVQHAHEAVHAISRRAKFMLQTHGCHSPLLFIINRENTIIIEYENFVRSESLETATSFALSFQRWETLLGVVLVFDTTTGGGLSQKLAKKFGQSLIIYSEFLNGTLSGIVYPYVVQERQNGEQRIHIKRGRNIFPEYVKIVSLLPTINTRMNLN